MSDSDGWRGIETAPKDGSRILVFSRAKVFVVSWDNIIGAWFQDSDCPVHYPTHWMPVPAPPSAS